MLRLNPVGLTSAIAANTGQTATQLRISHMQKPSVIPN